MPLERIEEEIARLSPKGFMCGFHLRFSRPVRHTMNYGSEWVSHYTRENYIAADPIAIWGISNTGTWRWSELEGKIPDPLGVFAKAKPFGLIYGAAISHGPADSRTICGMSREDREYTDAELQRLTALVIEAHDLLDQRLHLRPILIDALHAIACGMTYQQAAEYLGISRTALRYRLTTAQRIMGASDVQDAIRRAIDSGKLPSNKVSGYPSGLPTEAAIRKVSSGSDDDATSATP